MRTVRLLICGAVFYWAISGIIDLPWRTALAVVVTIAVIGWWFVNPFVRLARTVALALAVWSHGPATGVESDRCYPARAAHLLGWIRTGDNPRVVPKFPEQGRWCAHCAAPEWCLAPDGTVHPHRFEPASEDS